MLTLKNIDVFFGNNHILKDLSCYAYSGDFIVIVGANGAGKSTFFDTIAGKVLAKNGFILIDNVNITSSNEQKRAKFITRIFQNTQLNSVGSFTVYQNLSLARYSRRYARLVDGMNALSRIKAEEIMHNLGLNISILDKQMNTLSGGQRQLIAFAMSTQLIPKILLLDEPTAALDPQSATKLLQYAAQFIKQHSITTLLITHDPHIALNIGNKIWVLENGKIAKEFGSEDKRNLHANQLIGQIDYAKLS